MSDISITYDLLFDIIKIEKSREDLQKLDEKFYKDVIDYLSTKKAVIDNPNTPIRERELTKIQLGNVKRLLIELYERREKKIINLAIYKVKTGDGIITTEILLSEEKVLFNTLYVQLSRYRSEILDNVLEGIIPDPQAMELHSTAKKIVPIIEDDDTESVGIKSVRFIKSVPRFLGSELEIYGPFEENDIASLPSKIADILVKKNRAEEMHIN
ncbi:MAG: hypothetical protein ACP5N1_04365 [Candidatus Woesearchaeota archaeon]